MFLIVIFNFFEVNLTVKKINGVIVASDWSVFGRRRYSESSKSTCTLTTTADRDSCSPLWPQEPNPCSRNFRHRSSPLRVSLPPCV